MSLAAANCQAANKTAAKRDGGRLFSSRPKLHYKPLNLIFSLHSHEVEAFRETVTQVTKSSGQLSSSLPTRILPTRFRLVPCFTRRRRARNARVDRVNFLLLRRFPNLAKSQRNAIFDREKERKGPKAVKGGEFQRNSFVRSFSLVRCVDTLGKMKIY